MREESWFLRFCTYGFGVLVVLGLLGLVLVRTRLRKHLWLFLSGGVYTLVVSVFYIITRLKIPMVPILLIPAVMGLMHIWTLRRWHLPPLLGAIKSGTTASWPRTQPGGARWFWGVVLGAASDAPSHPRRVARGFRGHSC